MPPSTVLNACIESLPEFDKERLDLPSMSADTASGRGYAPYTLQGHQVGAIHLLLYHAKKLEKENAELKQMLADAQAGIDGSINYLDLEP